MVRTNTAELSALARALTAGGVADNRIHQVRQLHRQPLDLTAEELGRALHGIGQAQALAGGADGGSVTNLCLTVTVWDNGYQRAGV